MQLDVTSDAAFQSFLPGQPQEDDKSLIVEFFVDKKLLGAKSEAAGRQVYEDREYCRIRVKGQPHQVVVEEVKDSHRQKFPYAYHAFVMKKPVPVVGTPIEQLPGVGPSQAEQLKLYGIRTVEDMANVSDENTFQRIGMGARDLQKRAKAYIDKTNEKTVSLEQENAMLKEQLRQMNERMAALEVPRNRRGVPKKIKPQEPQP